MSHPSRRFDLSERCRYCSYTLPSNRAEDMNEHEAMHVRVSHLKPGDPVRWGSNTDVGMVVSINVGGGAVQVRTSTGLIMWIDMTELR